MARARRDGRTLGRPGITNPAMHRTAERIRAALAAGLTRFAVVLPASGLATMNLRERLGKVPSTKMRVGFFGTVDEARAWLAE